MLHIAAATEESWPLSYLSIYSTPAVFQQPMLGLRLEVVSYEDTGRAHTQVKLPQGTGGLSKYGKTVCGVGKPSEPELHPELTRSLVSRQLTLFSPHGGSLPHSPDLPLLSLGFCPVLTCTRIMRAPSDPVLSHPFAVPPWWCLVSVTEWRNTIGPACLPCHCKA